MTDKSSIAKKATKWMGSADVVLLAESMLPLRLRLPLPDLLPAMAMPLPLLVLLPEGMHKFTAKTNGTASPSSPLASLANAL